MLKHPTTNALGLFLIFFMWSSSFEADIKGHFETLEQKIEGLQHQQAMFEVHTSAAQRLQEKEIKDLRDRELKDLHEKIVILEREVGFLSRNWASMKAHLEHIFEKLRIKDRDISVR